jgi:O-antigen/teichoic acid export membrane protein
MHAAGRHASLRQLLIRGTKYGAALIAPITLMLVVFAGRIIAIWLGPDFAGQALSAQVLVFPHVLVSMGLMGDAIIISRGRLGRRVPYILAQAVVNVVLSALLIPKYGVLGVAIGTAASHLIDFPLHINFLLKETGVTLGEWMREVVAPVYPLLLLPIALGIGLAQTPLADSLIGIAVASAIAIGAYWVALFFVGLTPFEREEFGHAATQAWAKVRRTA